MKAWELIKQESTTFDVNVEPILTYFENTWLNSDFPPEDWNQFGIFDMRTNNQVERYNGNINTILKTKPNLIKFYDFLREEENKMAINLLQTDKEPFYVTKSTKEAKKRLANEKTLQDMLNEHKLELVDYLNKYAANLNTLDVIEQYEVDEGIEADIDSDANDKDDMRMWEGDGNNKKSLLLKAPSKRSHNEIGNDGNCY